jgi:hypothetical protein
MRERWNGMAGTAGDGAKSDMVKAGVGINENDNTSH